MVLYDYMGFVFEFEVILTKKSVFRYVESMLTATLFS